MVSLKLPQNATDDKIFQNRCFRDICSLFFFARQVTQIFHLSKTPFKYLTVWRKGGCEVCSYCFSLCFSSLSLIGFQIHHQVSLSACRLNVKKQMHLELRKMLHPASVCSAQIWLCAPAFQMGTQQGFQTLPCTAKRDIGLHARWPPQGSANKLKNTLTWNELVRNTFCIVFCVGAID